MVPIRYWCMRLLRRRLPQGLVEKMLDLGVFLQPGLDTRAPAQSVRLLGEACARHGLSLEGARVCVVGYGGSFGIGLALLDAGARHVVLQDPFAPLRRARIRQLDAERLRRYFVRRDGAWHPDPARITIERRRLEELAREQPGQMDVVFSSSVLEHVDNVETLVGACAQIVRPGGLNLHAIDLRDHYFRYPFEMLCYSRQTWEEWLNTSNLNRWRYGDYRRAFERYFNRCDTIVTEALPAEFARTKARIRPEFLTGDDTVDNVGTIRIEARRVA